MPASAAAPSNDAFANARSIGALPATIAGNNASATMQRNDPASQCTSSVKTIWYRLTLPNAAYVLVDTHGSQHWTGVSIWRGPSLSTLSEVACSYGSGGEPGGGYFGRVTFKAAAGQRYYVRVNATAEDAHPAPGGAIRLTLRTVTPPSNDLLSGAIRIKSLPFQTTASTVRATSQPGETRIGPCFWTRATVWYLVRPTSTVTLRADTFGTGFDTLIGIFTGAARALISRPLVGCDDDTAHGGVGVTQSSVTWRAVAGETYWIQVGGYENENGTFHLAVQQVTPPANNDRQRATVIPNVEVSPFNIDVSTRNATPQQGETIQAGCGSADELLYPQSVWFRYTAPNAHGVSFHVTTPPGVNPVLSIYTGTTFANQQAVACGGSGTVALSPQTGTTYYVQIAGLKGRSGSFHLSVAPEPH
jgi:hypothetical protein